LRLSNSHLRLGGVPGGIRLGLPSFLIGLLGGLVLIASLHSTIGPAILIPSAIVGSAVLTPVAIAAGGRTGPALAATAVAAHAAMVGPIPAAIAAGAAAAVAAGVAPATTITAATSVSAAAATPPASTAAATATTVPSAPTASTVLCVGDANLAVAGKRLQVCQEGHDGKRQYRNRDVSDELLHSHFLVLLRG
jgi:hypothetical protein